MKTIAVTGSTGMIGKVLIKNLKRRGYGVKYFDGRVENESAVKDFVKGVDGVIHLAAKIDLNTSNKDFYNTNVLGARNIAKAAKNNKLRMVMVSTIMVFEESKNRMRDETWFRRRESENGYVNSKVQGDKQVRKVNNKAITVYPCIVLDKDKLFGGETKMTGIVGWIWKNIGAGINGGIMASIGKSDRHINIVEVNDVVEGIILAWEKGVEGDDYILGGENIEIGEYLKLLRRKAGVKGTGMRIPYWPFGILRNLPLPRVIKNMALSVGGDMFFSSDKAKKVLGYSPKWKLR